MNPAGKLTSIIAGMAAGADSIDDLDVVRSGGMKRLFGGVYAPATLGQFLREFTHGHTLQLASVLRAHLVNLVQRTDLLPGIERAGVRRHRLAAAPGVRPRQAGRQLRAHQDRRQAGAAQGPVAAGDHDQHRAGAPVVAGIRLRAGKAGSGKGAASMVTEAIRTARAAGATGEILVRGDSAYGNSAVVAACLKAGARFSVVLAKNPAVTRAIAAIPDDAWTPVHYPGAVVDPDTGELISDAEVAEVPVHRVRLHQAAGHRPADRAPGPRPRQDRRAVPGLAPPPVPHQQRRADRRKPTSPTAGTRSSRPCSPT